MAVHRRSSCTRHRQEPPLSNEQKDLLAEIRSGLNREQKELPSRLFYDERGSELFEEITLLPEYYLTRAELALISEHVPGWIAGQRPRSLMELGAGNATKARMFLDAMRPFEAGMTYVPVDISAEFLDRAASALRSEYPRLEVAPIASSFAHSLELTTALARPAMITFLGSTIGNFTTAEAVHLLRRISAAMHPGDRFVLGVDLRKDPSVLEAAYNDSRGVTAEFNLNILRVINDRFGAGFDLHNFRHQATYAAPEHRVEMHLVSLAEHSVHLPGVGVIEIRKGESIRTEISCKYDRASVQDMFAGAGLDLVDWRAAQDGMFALCLARSATVGHSSE